MTFPQEELRRMQMALADERKVTEKLSRNLELEKRRCESLEQKVKGTHRRSMGSGTSGGSNSGGSAGGGASGGGGQALGGGGQGPGDSEIPVSGGGFQWASSIMISMAEGWRSLPHT